MHPVQAYLIVLAAAILHFEQSLKIDDGYRRASGPHDAVRCVEPHSFGAQRTGKEWAASAGKLPRQRVSSC